MPKFPYVPVLIGAAVLGGVIYYMSKKTAPATDRSQVPVGASQLRDMPGVMPGRVDALQERMRQAGFN